ncbi:MAG: DUF368 domain-containing protein [Bacillota bacterium]|nr:DUF368 domain-containing protein [Bacillota bacterium]
MRNAMVVVKGTIIGGTMLVPGVSGGSMAIILGIYDKLITSVSSFGKHKLESFLFLLLFVAGGFLGIFLFSRPILYMIQQYPMPMLYFFLGAVAGGIPLILRKAQVRSFSFRGLGYVMLGVIIVAALSMIPMESSQSRLETGLLGIFLLMLAGFIAAIALVLPGISVSYLLLIAGLYDETMQAISQFYMPFLIPLGIGLLLGILLTTRLLEKAMLAYPQPTYLMILGFVLGSLIEVFPGVPSGWQILLCIVTMFAGFAAIMWLSRKEG